MVVSELRDGVFVCFIQIVHSFSSFLGVLAVGVG